MSTQRSRDPATSAVDVIDGCVRGVFTRDYANRNYGTTYATVEFVAGGLAFEGRWVIFRDPAFVETWHYGGFPAGRATVKSFVGTHRVPASRVREITYDHADDGDCAAA